MTAHEKDTHSMRKSLRDAIKAELVAAQAVTDAAIKEDRDMTDDERTTMNTHLGKAEDMTKRGEEETALMAKFAALTDGIKVGADDDTPVGIMGKGQTPPSPESAAAKARSIGEQFVSSAEYKSMLAAAPNGTFSEKARVQSQPFGVKTLLTGANHTTSAGALTQSDYRGLLDPFYQRPMSIRDLVAPGNTTSDTIEYVRLVSVTNAAKPVAEATSSAFIDGTTVTPVMGGLKPESAMAFQKDVTTVKTIAHWIPATKRALADAAQIRTLIDQFLRYGLEEELEDQIVAGNGVGENFLGISQTPGIQTQAAPTAGQDVFDITRQARRKVQLGGRAMPTAYVFNPIDWEAVDLSRNDAGDFYGAGPFALTAPRLWGLPVVESEAVPAGEAYVGAWNYAVLYDREQASVQATDTHADFFTRNLVAILAELRAAFAVLRPAAFVKIDLTP
jgi:HK97 family phage major capsid protein